MLSNSDESNMTVETQLAIIRTKMDQLIELTKERGEDHEARIRTMEISGAGQDHESRIRQIEEASAEYLTRKAAVTLIVVTCTVATAIANFIALWLR